MKDNFIRAWGSNNSTLWQALVQKKMLLFLMSMPLVITHETIHLSMLSLLGRGGGGGAGRLVMTQIPSMPMLDCMATKRN